MKLKYPKEKGFTWNQPFSKNYNAYYKEGGLLGHTGIDMARGYGSNTYCAIDSLCTGVGNKDNPDLMKYRAVYTLVDDIEGGVAYEVSYGHLGEIFVEAGQELKAGDNLGTESNTGDVASGGVKITQEMKDSGSKAGSHLHFQVRLLKKVQKKEKGKQYLKNTKGKSVMKDDCYFEIPYYNNGFNGCIDPMPFFTGEYAYSKPIVETIKEIFIPKLTQTLRYGSRGNEVKMLQQYLGIKADGIFGRQTEEAVKKFQWKNGLVNDGIVGSKTREVINK